MATVKGVAPGFLLLPAREYSYELKKRVAIELPISGSTADLLKSAALGEGVKIGLEEDFNLFEEDVFYLWQVVGVLFAKSKYPQLSDDEMLSVVAIEKLNDKIILHGEILKCV